MKSQPNTGWLFIDALQLSIPQPCRALVFPENRSVVSE
jgi:hypothetical protein